MGNLHHTDTKTNLIVNKMSRTIYKQLKQSGEINENELYDIIDDDLDANDQTIKNVADPELSSDAANKQYVDSLENAIGAQIAATSQVIAAEVAARALADQQLEGKIPTAVSELENDAGYVSAQMSVVYRKWEDEDNEEYFVNEDQIVSEISSQVNSKVVALSAKLDTKASAASDVRLLRPSIDGTTQIGTASAFQVKHVRSNGITLVGGYGTGLRYIEDGVEHIAKTSAGVDMTAQRIGTFDVGYDSAGKQMVLCSVESGDPNNKLAYWSYDCKTWTSCSFPSNTVLHGSTAVRYNKQSKIWTVCTVDNIVNGSKNPNPMCMLSKDGKSFTPGPAISTSCTAYSVVEYGDGFIYMRAAGDDEGQMVKCTNIRESGGIWQWDYTVLTKFSALEFFMPSSGTFTCRAFAYGNGFFLAGEQATNRLAKIYPDGKTEMITLPSGCAVRSICFNCGTFFIAAYNNMFTTNIGTVDDIRTVKGFDDTQYAGKVYGIDSCDGMIYVAAKASGTVECKMAVDENETVVDIIHTVVGGMFSNGEELSF